MLTVKGTKVRFKRENNENLISDDAGLTWYFSSRSENAFREMWRNHTITGHIPHDTDERDEQLETFGDTLDEPIPDDFADILLN